MEDNNEEVLKKHLLILLNIFKDKPHLLIKYIINNNVLDDKIQKNLINNKSIKDKLKEYEENDDLETPFFYNFNDMEKYYNKFFYTSNNEINNSASKEDTLILDLKEAIINENYEKAAKIKDYCIKNKINIDHI